MTAFSGFKVNPCKKRFCMPTAQSANFDGDDASAQAARRYGTVPYFFPRRALVCQTNPQHNTHDHMVESFRNILGKAV